MDRALLKQLLQPSVVIGATAAIAILVIGAVFYTTDHQPSGSYATVVQGPITQIVSSTGDVKAADSLDLAFQVGGQIAYAGPAVGTHVGQGATLASLDAADAQASLEQAKAALAVQQANLDALKAGSRPEDVAVSQTAVTNAQASVAQTKQSLVAAAQDAYAKSDDAIHNKVDQFFNNPRTPSPTLAFELSDYQLQNSLVAGRLSMEGLLSDWQLTLQALPADASQVDTAALASTTRSNLQAVNAYLDEVASGLTKAITTGSYTTATIQGYESNVAAARAAVSADLTAIDGAATAEQAAESALASAQSQLTLTQAGPTTQSLEAQEAQVAAAQANVDAAQAELDKTAIVAPISGTITVNNAHVGEIAAAGSPLVSMISDTQFQFETYVSQADLGKLKVGQEAAITLDAYEGQPLSAHVIAIDPAATVQSGVSSYKVTLQFDQNDSRVAAGLTGSADITTASEDSALTVPTSAIIIQGAQQYVLLHASSGDQEVPVTTGISSQTGMTQVLSGLSAGQEVRSFGAQTQ